MSDPQSDPPSYIPTRDSDTAARDWIDAHKDYTGYVNGQWLTAPVDPEQVVQATHDALRRNVQDISGFERNIPEIAGYLQTLSNCIEESAQLLAVVDSLVTGQPIQRSQKMSVPLAARYAQYYVGWALRTDEERIGWVNPDVVLLELSSPALLLVDIIRHVVLALAEGNVLVISAPPGSYSALLLADLCRQTNLPAGLVNVVIDGVAASHWHLPRRVVVTAERAPTVLIFDDADLDSAVEGAVEALWLNPDRTRESGAKLLVQAPIASRVLAKLRARIATIRSGDALDKTVEASSAQASGEALELETGRAPVVQLFRTSAEGMALINDLNATAVSLWTGSIGLAVNLAHAIKAATVWVNAVHLYDPALDSRIAPRVTEALPRPIPWLPAAGIPERQQLESLYINGQFVRSDSGETRLIGGANSRLMAEICIGSKTDIDKAVSAAATAAETWVDTSHTDRLRIMYRLADLMRHHKKRLADSIAARSGESHEKAEAVVDLRIEQLLMTTAAADNMARSQQQVTYRSHRALALTVPEPIGVLGVIDPVSLLYELTRVVGQVLANSATAVIIPSERYPLTALTFCELLTLAEVPPGVMNMVPGDQAKLTAALRDHKNVTLWQPSGAQPLPIQVKTIWLPCRD